MRFFITITVLSLFSFGAKSAPSLENFFKGKSKLKNPFSLRDPFRAPINTGVTKKGGEGKGIVIGNEYSNVPKIGQVKLNEIKIIGILVGKNRKAIARIGDKKETFILEEGMKLGIEAAELKAILPAGIVLVERIVNVYGQEEYLETVIPISQK
ncbi:MAG: hypothetical protein HOE90_06165 [Bacteriovoracaceae bacterium]|jgi:hypothetical protein|nr:hypothetical protein [Bacteriovoracaceae bacterium]